ncbi:hypothetical protein EV401DRAFT_1601701 [Pisolithus croceorrhizus]|nr:hypothetical protein EV401DRAFT_1601701 [Pisolithus croceorrhizus]
MLVVDDTALETLLQIPHMPTKFNEQNLGVIEAPVFMHPREYVYGCRPERARSCWSDVGGETDERHAKVWHPYRFYGRVREWVGRVGARSHECLALETLPQGLHMPSNFNASLMNSLPLTLLQTQTLPHYCNGSFHETTCRGTSEMVFRETRRAFLRDVG